ncbi:MAG: Fpg/Nei family DNA glycosylase [Acidimicrobiia bacterium]
MPEGHTIHRIAREHSALLVGKAVGVSSPQGRFAADAARVDGATLDSIEPFGKHLFYWWDTGEIGHVHLGLFGTFRVSTGDAPPDPVGAVRMRMTVDGVAIDLAGPTACSIDPPDQRAAIIARLGPDPLRRDARPDVAIERMQRRRQAIGALLLDQSVVSGVGNVYRAEALFVNGIHPTRAGKDCSNAELEALWTTIVAMLRKGVKDGRIVTVARAELPTRLPRGQRPRRGEATYVYHRDRCLRCGTPIQTIALAGRACYFCPTCQPA